MEVNVLINWSFILFQTDKMNAPCLILIVKSVGHLFNNRNWRQIENKLKHISASYLTVSKHVGKLARIFSSTTVLDKQ